MNIFPKLVYSISHECNVEVVGRGHFELTVMVQLPAGRIVEVDLTDLTDRSNHAGGNH